MTRLMYDSVTAKDIPTSARIVAGYVNGTYRWSAADWARFPNAVKVRIATQAAINDGHVLDVEPGDATPDQAPGWVQMRRRAGVDPTVYCNQLNGWSAVRQAFRDRGVREPHYWVARYDNVATIPTGAVAKQYANPPLHGLGHFDLSAVVDYWPGIDQQEEQDMDSVQDGMLRGLDTAIGHTWQTTGRLAGEIILSTERLVIETLAAVRDDLDAETVLARLEAVTRQAVTETVLPAIQQIKDALATDNLDEAKAIADEIADRLHRVA